MKAGLFLSLSAVAAVELSASQTRADTAYIPAFSSTAGTEAGFDLWANPWSYSFTETSSSPESYTDTLSYSGTFKGLYDGGTYDSENFTVVLSVPFATAQTFSWGSLTNSLGWTPSTFGTQVTFNAPSGDVVEPGENFSFSISYVTTSMAWPPIRALNDAGTTASWDANGVPETSTWIMMGVGFGCLAFAGHRSTRKSRVLAA